MFRIIDGTKLAQELEAQLKIKGVVPCLGIIVFKNDRAGLVYTRLKSEAAARVGIKVIISHTTGVLAIWNQDPKIHGIMIQRPGYRGEAFEQYWNQLVAKIAPHKDVDGLRPDSRFTPATVKAVQMILVQVKAKGETLVVGRGMIGRQLAQRLAARNISSQDKNLNRVTSQADILISASGRPGIIKAVKAGAVVIDVGWPKGDVDLAAVTNKAAWVTPVPGGVGPVTVVCLLANLLEAVYNRL